jgi:uncharacterized protein YqjF (DUF2071 family)
MAIFLKANWENIVMANYIVPQNLLLPYLPKGIEVDMFENNAYISLVGFMFKNTKLFNVPIPHFGTFEEINLRFYVKRKNGNEYKRGVVFTNETVPFKIVAYIANKLYHESYSTVDTQHCWEYTSELKKIEYQWQVNKKWNRIYVEAKNKANTIVTGSLEEFIYEHYYGYAKINEHETEEYKIYHPSWKINSVLHSAISCDFKTMYGNEFEYLNQLQPQSVFIAEGSGVAVNWKRTKINI